MYNLIAGDTQIGEHTEMGKIQISIKWICDCVYIYLYLNVDTIQLNLKDSVKFSHAARTKLTLLLSSIGINLRVVE